MSQEQNPKRTVAVIQQEYTQACAELGNYVYRNSALASEIEQNEQAIEKLQKRMKKLNQEGSELMQAEQLARTAAESQELANGSGAV